MRAVHLLVLSATGSPLAVCDLIPDVDDHRSSAIDTS